MLKLYIGNKNYSSWIHDALAEKDFLDFEEPYRLTPAG